MAPRARSGSHSFSTLQTYLREIHDITPLSKAEEAALARRGGVQSLQELVRRNLKYVVLVANRYKGMGLSLTDLINEGNIGMLEAARRYDPDRGVKFITYAVWWIRQSIIQSLADNSRVVRVPVKQAGLLNKMSRKIEQLRQKLGREPALDELADELKLRRSTLETIMRVYKGYMSLDTPLKEGEGGTEFIDVLEAGPANSVEEDFVRLCLHHDMDRLLKSLPPREEKILRMRFGFDDAPMTLDQVGKAMGLTRERIRQIEKSAKEKLRTKAGVKILEEYLR